MATTFNKPRALEALGDLEKILQIASSLNKSTGALSHALELCDLASKFKSGDFRTGEKSMFEELISAVHQ